MLTREESDSAVGVGGSTDVAEEEGGVDRAEEDDEEDAVDEGLVALVFAEAVDDELVEDLREVAFDLGTDSVFAYFRALVTGSGLGLLVKVDLEESTETVAV